VAEAAQRIVQLLKDAALRKRLGQAARETVRQRFLMIRLLEQYLDLFNSFEMVYWLKRSPNEPPDPRGEAEDESLLLGWE